MSGRFRGNKQSISDSRGVSWRVYSPRLDDIISLAAPNSPGDIVFSHSTFSIP
jgi:hypothetical protein